LLLLLFCLFKFCFPVKRTHRLIEDEKVSCWFCVQVVRDWRVGEGKGYHSGVDLETLSQAEAYITAGCSFAIGLRFAGSHDKKAQQCLVREECTCVICTCTCTCHCMYIQ